MAAVIIEPQLANQILIEEKNATVAVQSLTSATVTIVNQGPQGPQGEAGPVGAGYDFVQSTTSSTWTINHNLGYKPSVDVYDSGSQEIDVTVSHTSVNQTLILLTLPSAGFARLT